MLYSRKYIWCSSENLPLLGMPVRNKLSFFLGMYKHVSMCLTIYACIHIEYMHRIQNKGLFAVLIFWPADQSKCSCHESFVLVS